MKCSKGIARNFVENLLCSILGQNLYPTANRDRMNRFFYIRLLGTSDLFVFIENSKCLFLYRANYIKTIHFV